MDTEKVQKILDWPAPSTVKGLQSFLGFANFYRCFIKNHSKTISNLTSLTKKDGPFVLTDQGCMEFEALKTCSQLLLSFDILTVLSILLSKLIQVTMLLLAYILNSLTQPSRHRNTLLLSVAASWRRRKSITRSMTRNFWPSSFISKNGARTCSAYHRPSKFLQTTTPWNISSRQSSWPANWLVGRSFWPNSTLSLRIDLGNSVPFRTLWHVETTFTQTGGRPLPIRIQVTFDNCLNNEVQVLFLSFLFLRVL